MTDQQIRDAVAGDQELLSRARVGDDAEIAMLLTESAPQVVGPERYITSLAIMAAFPDPAAGDAALTKLEAAGELNPVVKRALAWMAPGAPGLNIASPATLAMIEHLRLGGVLTQAEAETIRGLAMVPDTITADDVSAALLPTRTDGLVPGVES